jgi:ATP-dependent Clp protease adapter protein ClpS
LTIAMPDTTHDTTIEQAVDDLFDDAFAVVILDSDTTTFDEVELACVEMFGFTRSAAHELALHVHHRGSAVAAVLPRHAAEEAARQLTARNVRSRLERM